VDSRDQGLIISLCDHSGNWPRYYLEAGYTVVQVDPTVPTDLVHAPENLVVCRCTVADFIRYYGSWMKHFDITGVLMAPPCTHFSVSGAQYWKEKDEDGRTKAAVQLVNECLKVAELSRPDWWALENPVGRLPKLIPSLGDPWYFQPHHYAGHAPYPEIDRYTKKTGLWGTFSRALPLADLPPIRACKQGSWVQKLGGSSDRTKRLRSNTPLGFAKAFFIANP